MLLQKYEGSHKNEFVVNDFRCQLEMGLASARGSNTLAGDNGKEARKVYFLALKVSNENLSTL
jgi:hypothetical protein